MRKSLIFVALVLLVSLAWADEVDGDRGYLGVELRFTESIHVDGHTVVDGVGMFVSHVMSGSAAELAGLHADDRIVAIEGREIDDMEDLRGAMESRRKGDRVSVTVERDDSELMFNVVLGEMPGKLARVERFGVLLEPMEDRAFIGIESQLVEAQLARYFDVEGGILVTRVIEGTPAHLAGIEAGDVIVAWGETPLRKQHDIHEMISGAKPGDEVELLVSRRGVESRTFLTLDAAADHVREFSIQLHHEHLLHESHEDGHLIEVQVKEIREGSE